MYQWDAKGYQRSSANECKWAGELIEKLNLQGNERILDVGCGDGRVTAEIASRVKNGSVLGIDSSADMIGLARLSYAPATCPNLSFKVLDFRDLDFHSEFNVIFSNAALHWVKDQLAVLRRIMECLKPGGLFLAQQGGRGAERVFDEADQLSQEAPWSRHFQDFTFPLGFFGPEEYTEWLKTAGLTPVRVELLTKFSEFDSIEGFKGWIRFIWHPYTQNVPEDLRDEFVDAIAERYLRNHPVDPSGKITVKMLRLEVEARK